MREGALGLSAIVASLAFVAACASESPREILGSDHSPATGAGGYCRETTCPSDHDPTKDGQCQPAGWSDSAKCVGDGVSNAPLWWRTSCVGYDLNEAASRRVSYDAFEQATRAAFDTWATATCRSAGGSTRPSIDARDLGPVSCAHHAYDSSGGPNQNVIVFHDDAWPYEDADRKAQGSPTSLTIALTRVTYETQTGELFDADIELNSADFEIAPVDPGTKTDGKTFDLQSILTHEIGHFLGLAHSPLTGAVMNPSGDSDTSSSARVLAAEDMRGICAIYPPDRTRSVSSLVDPSGSVTAGACDPTPHHGFTATCD